MAIGEDRVQVTKVESTALGGKDVDAGIYGNPVPINPKQDAIESGGMYLQDAVDRDEAVAVFRDAGKCMLKDTENAAGLSLSTLASGGFNVDDIVLDKDSAFVTDGDGNLVIGV